LLCGRDALQLDELQFVGDGGQTEDTGAEKVAVLAVVRAPLLQQFFVGEAAGAAVVLAVRVLAEIHF